jgi:hypothetical protein
MDGYCSATSLLMLNAKLSGPLDRFFTPIGLVPHKGIFALSPGNK